MGPSRNSLILKNISGGRSWVPKKSMCSFGNPSFGIIYPSFFILLPLPFWLYLQYMVTHLFCKADHCGRDFRIRFGLYQQSFWILEANGRAAGQNVVWPMTTRLLIFQQKACKGIVWIIQQKARQIFGQSVNRMITKALHPEEGQHSEYVRAITSVAYDNTETEAWFTGTNGDVTESH